MQTERYQTDLPIPPRVPEALRMRDATPDAASETRPGDASLTTRLYVDLDGTLVATDTLWESLLLFARQCPLQIPMLFVMLFRGRAAFKAFVASHVTINAVTFPYRSDLLAYLRSEHTRGRSLVLATAAHRSIAEPVAAHLAMFESVIATDGDINVSGKNKLRAIQGDCGDQPFDYIGDAAEDIPIFAAARNSFLVSPVRRVETAARSMGRVTGVFSPLGESSYRHILRAMRPHQWAKNALVAVPLITSHLTFEIVGVMATMIAVIALSLVASGQYIINDLLDLEADRLHNRKRNRPFASGDLSVASGLLLSATLLFCGVSLAIAFLPPSAVFWLGAYFVLSLSYSLELKQHFVLDVLVLAALFTVRIFIGGAALEVSVSQWLLAFSLFLFMSLAFLKRYVEARSLPEDGSGEMAGRGYRQDDAVCILVAGAANGYLSILVYALYVSSERVEELYADPRPLWLGCPILAYWVTRVWFLAHRDEMHHDPVYFALTDRASYFVGLLLFAAIALAI